jgi:phosphoribosylanthranilate isomerase
MTLPSRRTRIKICGITNLSDARCAAQAGVDFLGFILFPKSPRYATPAQIAAITRAVREEYGAAAPCMVGVFVSEPAGRVQGILDEAHLDLAQLHGDEPPATVQQLYPDAFKAIRPQSAAEARAALAAYRTAFLNDEALPQLLVDAYHPDHFGGTGLQADLDVARSVAGECRLLLAGGLAPETVGKAIKVVHPWGVDVSSGVEQAKGIKDHVRLRAFVQAVRGAS